MPIAVRCPNAACARSFRVQDAAAGRRGKCPACGTPITIPSIDPVAAAEPVSATEAPTVPGPGPTGPQARAASPTAASPPLAVADVPTFILDPSAAAPVVGAGFIRFEAI